MSFASHLATPTRGREFPLLHWHTKPHPPPPPSCSWTFFWMLPISQRNGLFHRFCSGACALAQALISSDSRGGLTRFQSRFQLRKLLIRQRCHRHCDCDCFSAPLRLPLAESLLLCSGLLFCSVPFCFAAAWLAGLTFALSFYNQPKIRHRIPDLWLRLWLCLCLCLCVRPEYVYVRVRMRMRECACACQICNLRKYCNKLYWNAAWTINQHHDTEIHSLNGKLCIKNLF